MTRGEKPEISLLLNFLDQAYDQKAWHGPNLKSTIARVSAKQAYWRPNTHRHSIAEQVIHAAYWKYSVRRRIVGEKRGSFPLRGSNWIAVTDEPSEAVWKGYRNLLENEHRLLRESIVGFDSRRLNQVPQGSRTTFLNMISGIAAHDLYHAGQIQLLKRLQSIE